MLWKLFGNIIGDSDSSEFSGLEFHESLKQNETVATCISLDIGSFEN